MEWRLLIFLVIVMGFSSIAYADFGFSNPYLPKLEAPSVVVSGGGGNVSYGNTTTNNYFINQSTNLTAVAENVGNFSNNSYRYVTYSANTGDIDLTPWQIFTNVLRTNSWYNLVDDARIVWDATSIRWSTLQDWYMGKLTATTLNSTGGMIWNGTTAFRISDLNISGTGGSGGNNSWNQSYADTLYASHTNLDNNRTNLLTINQSWKDNVSITYLPMVDQRYNDTNLIVSVNNSWKANYTNWNASGWIINQSQDLSSYATHTDLNNNVTMLITDINNNITAVNILTDTKINGNVSSLMTIIATNITTANSSMKVYVDTQDNLKYDKTGGQITGDVVIVGNLTIIGQRLNATVTNQYLNGTFRPAIDNLFDLGTTTFRWANLYATNMYNVTNINSMIAEINTNINNNRTNLLTINDSWKTNVSNTYLPFVDQRYNDTNLIVSVNNSWKSNYTDWNASGYIQNWNISGFIINWGLNLINNITASDIRMINNISEIRTNINNNISNIDLKLSNNISIINSNNTFIRDYNFTNWVNASGLIKDWSSIIVSYNNSWNQSMAELIFATIQHVNNNVTVLDTKITNNVSEIRINLDNNVTVLLTINNSWKNNVSITYLPMVDQRYNDTNLIVSVNNSWKANYTNWNASGFIINWNISGFIINWALNIINNITAMDLRLTNNATEIRTNLNNNITSTISLLNTDINNNLTQSSGWINNNITASNLRITNNVSEVRTNLNNNMSSKLNTTGNGLGIQVRGNFNMTGYNITNVNMLTYSNQSFGIFINDSCVVIGNLIYKTSC